MSYLERFANGCERLRVRTACGSGRVFARKTRPLPQAVLTRYLLRRSHSSANRYRKQREPYRGNRQVIDDWLGGSVRLAAGLNSEERWIHVDITFAGEFRLGRYNYFEVKREKFQEAVEHAMGDLYDALCSWTWNKHEDPHRGESHIIVRKAGVDPNDGTDRLQQYEWLARTASAFRDAFGAILDKW